MKIRQIIEELIGSYTSFFSGEKELFDVYLKKNGNSKYI